MYHNAYLSRKETAAVRADRALMSKIRRGLRELKTGKVRLYSLDELFSK